MSNLLPGASKDCKETELVMQPPRVTAADLDQRLRVLETLLVEMSGVMKRVDGRLAALEAARELGEDSSPVPRRPTEGLPDVAAVLDD